MDDFTSRMATPGASSDPTKHVNYTFGMVLGVDDLTQEFAYHSGRDQRMMRDTIGYGTVNGLRVTVAPNANGEMEIHVSPGTALSPRGQLIHVQNAQCANLNKWLAIAKNKKAVGEEVGTPPASPVTLSIVLCYRSCPTDKVPVPGEPCRSEEDTMAYSRLRDDFKLELRLKRSGEPESPDQREENALRDFIKWLNEHLVVTEELTDLTDEAAFINALLQAAHPVTSLPSDPPPDFMLDNSPPAMMRVHTDQSCAFLRIAFRLWVTELRPRWRPAQFNNQIVTCGADDGEALTGDNCVLLADLQIPLTPDGLFDDTQQISVLEENRPYLIHLRMLQEWLTCGRFAGVKGGAAQSEIKQVLPLVSVQRFENGGTHYILWFHLDAPQNSVALTSFVAGDLDVMSENDAGPDFIANDNVLSIKPVVGQRNVFDVEVSSAFFLTRLVFNIASMLVQPEGGTEVTLLDYADERKIRFIGQDDGKTVTAYDPFIKF